MPEFDPPAYPDILTEKNWNKTKSLWAAIYGPTGVGDAMVEMKREYDDMKWELFHFVQLIVPTGPTYQMSNIDKYYAVAEKQLPQAKKVEAAAGKLEALALKTAKGFKTHALVPKGSTEHAAKVVLAAGKFGKEMGPQAMKAFLEMRYKIGKEFVERQTEKQAKAFKGIYTAIDACKAKAKSVKTRADLVKFVEKELEVVRDEYATLNSLVEFSRADQRGWKRHCGRDDIPSEDSDVKDALANILDVLKGFVETMDAATKK